MTAFATAALSLLGVLLGAFLTHSLSTKRNRGDELAELRIRAYTDFISAASNLATARRAGLIKDEHASLTALNDAKTRICVCAPPSVIQALSEFWLFGGTLEREDEILAFTRLCNEIRASVGNAKIVGADTDLSSILFRLQPSSYSFAAHTNSKAERVNAAD